MTRTSARLKDTTARGSYPALRTSVRMRSLSKEAGRLPAIRTTAWRQRAGSERTNKKALSQGQHPAGHDAMGAPVALTCLTAVSQHETSAHIHGVDCA